MQWWGYEDINGDIHIRKLVNQQDIQKILHHPFSSQVIKPFEARDEADALRIINELLEKFY